MTPLLRFRALRVLLVASPGITAGVAILTASESNLGLVIALNAAAGIVISSSLFLAISLAARQVTDEQVSLVRSAGEGLWRARAEIQSIRNGDGFYTHWYLRLRLQEEVERARRYDEHFAVLAVKMLALHQENELTAGAWFTERIQRHLRKLDLAALLQDGTLVVLLPKTAPKGVATARKRLAKELAAMEPRIGFACYPEDGKEANELLNAAIRAAFEPAKADAAA
jgi:GGDEF domain-containing protein